ncbi:MAG: molybdenum cofactor guanylyltransferase [Phycisphaeraceae bacterium]|nr:molybdenum cofactor guanylyltransferase [Phycisphaeraceae bacterium]
MNPDTPPSPPEVPSVPAYILAGGRSSRFGSDKARALRYGHPLILRIAAMLCDRGHSVTVVARSHDEYRDLGLATIGDLEPDLGPIGGLRTALDHRRDGWIILYSCDLLHPDSRALDILISALELNKDAEAIAFRTDRWQPFPALYHTRLATRLPHRRDHSMQSLLNEADVRPLRHAEPQMFRQANTPAQLESDADDA